MIHDDPKCGKSAAKPDIQEGDLLPENCHSCGKYLVGCMVGFDGQARRVYS